MQLFLLGVILWTLVLTIATSVLAAQIDGHDGAEDGAHGEGADQADVAGQKLGRVLGLVDVGGDAATKIAETDVHGDADTTLDRSTDVVTIPCNTLRNVGVDTRRSKECAGVLDVRLVRRSKQDEAKDAGQKS